MPEFRYNVLTGEWVIIATERAKRPMEFAQTIPRMMLPKIDPACPFCPGNERYTAREVARIDAPDGHWLTRVIKNKYPALQENCQPARDGDILHTHINGFGIHEVIIDSPRHDCGMTGMPVKNIEYVLQMYRNRYRTLEQDPRVKHIIIFKNNGEKAGSSLVHPHSQLIATPIVSGQIYERIRTTREYRRAHGRCIMCDMLRSELESEQRIICRNKHFVSFLPYAALSSFHTWIFPIEHSPHFGRIRDEHIHALADILSHVLRAQEKLLHCPDFNFVVRSAPIGCMPEDYHWYISIIPRLTKTAGFEIGSNIYINGSLPELNAMELRNVVETMYAEESGIPI